jgi:hypothetical protein
VLPIKNLDPNYNKFTKQEVIWMYTMKTRFWEDGTKITVFYLKPDSKIHKQFCNNVLGITPASFDSMVRTKLNMGNASYFRQAKSESDVYNKVELIPGSIGYVSENTMYVNGGGYVRKITIVD